MMKRPQDEQQTSERNFIVNENPKDDSCFCFDAKPTSMACKKI